MMITEIEPIAIEIVPSRKVRGMGLTTFSTPMQAMCEPLNNCLFHSLKSKSNNSRHIFHPFDKQAIRDSLAAHKALQVIFKKSAVQRAAPIELELKLETIAPIELKSLNNLTQRNAMTQVYAYQQLLFSLSSNGFTNYIDPKEWEIIEKEFGFLETIVSAFLDGPAAPELPELGTLQPSPNLNYVRLYEPTPDRPNTYLGDVRDTEIVDPSINI